ncbi:uncharacterized protein LOC142776727 [Rhipicephalus microplus]|uniref:uncharacterized protein LOC142776727 n=1 Tax=Rhipicephalus microplus TaxID=6941 RepID=UPI003F6C9BC3
MHNVPKVPVFSLRYLCDSKFLLLGISSEAGAQQDALRLVIAAAKTEDACAHGTTFADNRWWTPPPGRSTSTEQHIRRPSPSYHFSGHVGWPVSNMPNPFLFFVQAVNEKEEQRRHPEHT